MGYLRRRLRLALFVGVLLLFAACKKNPVGPEVTPNVQLSLDYAACTEVWLKIGFTDSPGGGDYRIDRDGSTVLAGTFSGASAIVYDTTAQAAKSYTYTAYRISSGQVKQISPSLSVMTLDSTSHNFTWQTFVLGVGYSSALRDVAIINDTLLYAVGSIYLNDSTGQLDPQPYAIAIWNAVDWRLKKIFDANDQLIPNLRGIFIFGSSNIWLTDGGVHHWDGISQQALESFDRITLIGGVENGQSVDHLWGNNTNNLYGVGTNGMVGFYNGKFWTKIQSGTTLPINDIWGSTNSQSGETEIHAIASNKLALPTGKMVLTIDGNSVSSVPDSGLPWALTGIWFSAGKSYYIVGDGICTEHSLTSIQPWKVLRQSVTQYYTEAIRGADVNDIMVVGDYGEVLHFNGVTWRSYFNETKLSYGNYYAVAIKGNLAVVVGMSDAKAVVAIGRR